MDISKVSITGSSILSSGNDHANTEEDKESRKEGDITFNWQDQKYDGFFRKDLAMTSPLKGLVKEDEAKKFPRATESVKRKMSEEPPSKKQKIEVELFENNLKLPKELKEQFLANKCNICNCEMTSNVMASQHYNGKNHKKKIKQWFDGHPELAKEYQESIELTSKKSEKVVDPDRLYCKYCDLTLTSEVVAQAHYIGKKHQEVMRKGRPLNSYFNLETNQWCRIETANEDKSGRFGIGLDFLVSKTTVDTNAKSTGHKFFCNICQVACGSQTALDSHCTGAKHMRKWTAVQNVKDETHYVTNDNILESVITSDKSKSAAGTAGSPSDLSIYRTPSGNYYCKTCDISMNSQSQFQQHTTSKKHKNKSANKK